MIVYLMLFLIPVFQIGVSYYGSVFFAAFVFSAAIALRDGLVKAAPIIVVGLVPFMVKALINAVASAELKDVLLPLREALCFAVIFLIASSVEAKGLGDRTVYIQVALLALILLVVTVQSAAIASGSYVGFPREWFAMNRETLEGVEEALRHQTRFRPTAFYGEPSYTAFIVCSLLVLSIHQLRGAAMLLVVYLLAIGIVAVSQSVAGVVAVTAISVVSIFSRAEFSLVGRASVALVGGLALVMGVLWSDDLADRLMLSALVGDESFIKRFVEPSTLLTDVMAKGYIFGVDDEFIRASIQADAGLDNAALRLLIYYGLLAILPLALVFWYASSPVLFCYLLVVLNFNGGFFSYDKAAIVGVVLGVVRYSLKRRVGV